MATPRHFLQMKDLAHDELAYLFDRTRIIKARFKAYQRYWPLQDRTLVMIFEKASTRTRPVSYTHLPIPFKRANVPVKRPSSVRTT